MEAPAQPIERRSPSGRVLRRKAGDAARLVWGVGTAVSPDARPLRRFRATRAAARRPPPPSGDSSWAPGTPAS